MSLALRLLLSAALVLLALAVLLIVPVQGATCCPTGHCVRANNFFGARSPRTALLRAANYWLPVAHDGAFLPVTAVLREPERLRASWRAMKREALALPPEALPSFAALDSRQHALCARDGKRWDVCVLKAGGQMHAANAARCPETARVLRALPEVRLAMFSRLAPGKRLAPHRGPWRGVVRVHLGLSVPEPGAARLVVGGEPAYAWREGELVAFDDTYRHRAENTGSAARIVLFCNVARPGALWGLAGAALGEAAYSRALLSAAS